MRDDTKVVIKYALFIIINCHIYVNHIRLFCSFYLKKKMIISFCTLLSSLIVSLIKIIIYIYKGQLIFLQILIIILVITRAYENML